MARDYVAGLEDDVERATAFGRKYMAESAQRIAPRPLGTRRVSKPDQRFDWQNRNPEYLHQMLMQAKTDAKTQGMGFVEAVKLFLKKSREMDNGST